MHAGENDDTRAVGVRAHPDDIFNFCVFFDDHVRALRSAKWATVSALRRSVGGRQLARGLRQRIRRDEPLVDHGAAMLLGDLLEASLPDVLEHPDDRRTVGRELPRAISRRSAADRPKSPAAAVFTADSTLDFCDSGRR